MTKRVTWQREAVRDALTTSEGFVSAQSLYGALRESGSPIGLATVYRALSDLAVEGEAVGKTIAGAHSRDPRRGEAGRGPQEDRPGEGGVARPPSPE